MSIVWHATWCFQAYPTPFPYRGAKLGFEKVSRLQERGWKRNECSPVLVFQGYENVSGIARWKERNTPFLLPPEALILLEVSLGSQLLKGKFRAFTDEQVLIIHCNLLTLNTSRGWLRTDFRFGDVCNILSVRKNTEKLYSSLLDLCQECVNCPTLWL